METKQFKDFWEFYPYYLQEHSSRLNKILHFIGTLLVIVFLFVSLYSSNYWWLILLPFCGYGFAWVGHFFVEKNKPATFKHPFYSLLGDFIMFAQLLTGKLKF